MTIPTQLVLRALLSDPSQELYGVEIGQAAGLPSGTVHPILARLEGVGWLDLPLGRHRPQGRGTPSPPLLPAHPRRPGTGPGRPGPRLQRHRPARLAATPRRRVMTALMGSRGTGQTGRPTWWASLVVRSAALPLPSEHRWRYRQEFLAELHGMTPAEQRHHACGVLSRVVALRVALSERGPAHVQGGNHDALALSNPTPPLAAAAQSRRRLVPRMPGVRKTTGRHWWAKLGRRSPAPHRCGVAPASTSGCRRGCRWPRSGCASSCCLAGRSALRWNRGTVDTVACRETTRGKRRSQRNRPCMTLPAAAGSSAGLVGGVLAGGGRACQHGPARSLHPGRGGRTRLPPARAARGPSQAHELPKTKAFDEMPRRLVRPWRSRVGVKCGLGPSSEQQEVGYSVWLRGMTR